MDDDPYRNAITEALITQYYGQPGRNRQGDMIRAFGNRPELNGLGQPFRPSPPGRDEWGNPLYGGATGPVVGNPFGGLRGGSSGGSFSSPMIPVTPAPSVSMPPIPNPEQLPSYISKGAGTDPSIPPPVRMPQPVDELPPGYYK
jgi:hypothetical protein